jgi:hypothetical protein
MAPVVRCKKRRRQRVMVHLPAPHICARRTVIIQTIKAGPEPITQCGSIPQGGSVTRSRRLTMRPQFICHFYVDICPITYYLRFSSLVVRDVIRETAFDGAGAGSAGRVRHLIRGRPGHHARPARVRTVGCLLHWCRRGSAELPFASGDSRKRWPGPGWKATSINPIVEHRKVSGPVTRAAAVPGNGCSSLPDLPGNRWSPPHRSVLRFPL